MNRKDQYKRKLEFIIDKITNLPENVNDNEYYRDALYYRLQVAIDATMDVVAMLCKDFGISVKDDYSNLDELEKTSILTTNLIKELHQWNGLRNILVHGYYKIEDETVIKEKIEIVSSLKVFVTNVEVIINEKINFSE